MADLISMLAACGGAGGEVDPNFNQTVLLLHGDGTNGAQNNTFVDSSTNNFTITRNGNTTQGTFSPFSAPDGRWSNYFDGTGDYFGVTNDNVFDTNSTFTLEVWVYLTATSTQQIFGRGGGGSPSWNTTNGTQFALYYDSGGIVWQWNNAGSATSISGGTVNLNTWNHVAVGYDGTTTRLWLNGTSIGSSATGYTLPTTRNVIRIGSWTGTASEYLSGYASNLRFVKGTDVYGVSNTSITVPTNSLTAITNTALLTCQSNRFVDNSSNAFAITRNGDVKVTPFSPFAPTAAYSASVNGGSGYFDGTGDYLSIADDANLEPGSSNLTFEAWVYLTATPPAGGAVVISKSVADSYGPFNFQVTSSRTVALLVSTTGTSWTTVQTTATINLNEWVHLAWTRSGTDLTVYINGTSSATGSVSGSLIANSEAVQIGYGNSATTDVTGYIAGLRYVIGSANSITVPTAPPTAITNTALLCNFTNAGIFDNTGKNNLETVGNAQIDTTTKKYGTGSLEFDGTGDGLITSPSNNNVLGAGDFTIQFWIYVNNTTTAFRTIIASENYASVANGWIIYQYGSAIQMYYATAPGTPSIFDATSALTASTWHFVSIVRESGTIKCFVDGTEKTSSANTINFSGEKLFIGTRADNTLFLDGFIDDLRITKGIARDGTVVPTKAFPDL